MARFYDANYKQKVQARIATLLGQEQTIGEIARVMKKEGWTTVSGLPMNKAFVGNQLNLMRRDKQRRAYSDTEVPAVTASRTVVNPTSYTLDTDTDIVKALVATIKDPVKLSKILNVIYE